MLISKQGYLALAVCMGIIGLLCGCHEPDSDTDLNATNTNTTQISAIKNGKNAIEVFSPNVDSITRDFRTFWNYWNENTNLAIDYIALNEQGEEIGHEFFLKELKSGKYLPLLVKKDSSMSYFKLTRLRNNAVKNIAETIKYEAARYYKYSQMEGKVLPEFNFKDLDGHAYNTNNCKGKILILNTWFVKCASCKEEMPDLNRLQASYSNRNDIVFLGLCLDDAKSIRQFLTGTPFTYHLIADAAKYNQERLAISVYPTNIIVDDKGKIVSVIEGNVDALKVKLARIASRH